jgi:hypothetical protein
MKHPRGRWDESEVEEKAKKCGSRMLQITADTTKMNFIMGCTSNKNENWCNTKLIWKYDRARSVKCRTIQALYLASNTTMTSHEKTEVQVSTRQKKRCMRPLTTQADG